MNSIHFKFKEHADGFDFCIEIQCAMCILCFLELKRQTMIHSKLLLDINHLIMYFFNQSFSVLKVSYLEMSFWCLQFSQKTNQNNST